jgi:AcrR family transcriptional regulator
VVRGGPDRPDSGLRSDARRNQQRILRAAARLLAADPAATIQQIADEAEVARPTVYRRYPTREALVEEIIAEAAAEFAVALDHVASHSGTGAEAIGQLVRHLARISADYPILISGSDGARQHRGGTHREMAALVSQFDAQIARGQQDRSVRTDLAPQVMRYSLFGALSMLLRQQPAGTRLDPDEIGEQVTSLFMEGLRPRTPADPGQASRLD